MPPSRERTGWGIPQAIVSGEWPCLHAVAIGTLQQIERMMRAFRAVLA